MNKSKVSFPKQRDFQRAYQMAYKLACDELAGIKDIAEQCYRSGASLTEEGSKRIIAIDYLNRESHITLPDLTISTVDSNQQLSLKDSLLILHYFLRAGGHPLSNQLITFKELPEGSIYFPNLYKRAVKPVLAEFGRQPQRLLAAAKNLGGVKANFGDMAVTIKGFPYVPLTIVLWQGDDELSPEGSILFDSSISDYLATEDITVLCQTVAYKLACIPER
ncbi:MAG: DUF3786 domain-containing protein [Dehalococcoidales bacterium]